MANLLQQLQNNEAVLVMYLANELESEDRAEVEQMLAGDARLRAECDQLHLAQNLVTQMLQRMDTICPLPATAEVAARRVSRMMKQRQLDELTARPLLAPRPQRHVPWWVYWVASAVAAVVGVVVWWGMQPDSTLSNGSSAVASSDEDGRQQDQQYALLDMTMRNIDDNGPVAEDAENQAQTLLTQSREVDKPLSLSILGTGEQTQ